MTNDDRSSYGHYREAVYARLNRYTIALDGSDDRMVAIIARAELPRYVRYWVTLLTKHEATTSGKCPTCSRWWRAVSAPCGTWKWAHAFLTIAPARTTVPLSWIDHAVPATQHQTRSIAT
jgi:sigma54-dependent transcription regulator